MTHEPSTPSPAGNPKGGSIAAHPALALGFRPFFLLAAAYSAITIPLWYLMFTGRMTVPTPVQGVAWHGHEMIFGFTVAVIAGFLLTAVRNWTGQPLPTGRSLGALVLLWLAGRLAFLTFGGLPYGVTAVVDLAFLPAVAIAIARPIIVARNKRNYAFIGLLMLFAGANLLFHLDPGGPGGRTALTLGLNIVLLIIVVVGGRVLPFFTQNGLPDVTVHRNQILDWLSLGSVALVLVLELATGFSAWTAGAALLAAATNGARMVGWASLQTLRTPILWVLHLAYVWIPIGFLAKGLAILTPYATLSVATHILTVGVIGTMILGMMARVGLGHTGRPLKVAPVITAAFLLLTLSVIFRSILPWMMSETYMMGLLVSSILWAVAFLLFLVVYLPILTQPRPDGKPG